MRRRSRGEEVISFGKLTLSPGQSEIVRQSSEALDSFPVAVNMTIMGGGKTYMAGALALCRGLKLFVVGPANTIESWGRFARENDIELADVVSYESLRSTKGRQPRHGWLTRTDWREEGAKATFAATEAFRDLLDEGILLVLDEMHKVKNSVDQYQACLGLLREIHQHHKSRAYLLSASQQNTKEQAVNLLYLLGFVKQEALLEMRGGRAQPTGLAELIERCSLISREVTSAIVKDFAVVRITFDTAATIAFELYVQVIQPVVSFSLSSDEINILSEKDVANKFYNIEEEEDRIRLLTAVKKLSSFYCYDEASREAKNDGMGRLTSVMVDVELALVNTFARLARADLENEEGKVILSLNYRQNVERLGALLKEYNPLILTGQCKAEKRLNVLAKFQADNGERRLLICTTKTGGESFDLDDKTGLWPRRMYISPCYSIQTLHQATGRIYRTGTKSTAYTRLVYAACAKELFHILDSLSRQSEIMSRILPQQVRDGVLFPGQYPEEYE